MGLGSTGATEPVVRAAIDCGANSVHVLVALAQDDRLRPLMDESTFLGLGVAARRGRLGEAKISELVATVVRYADAARRLGAGEVVVAGTDPFRRARDAPAAVTELQQAAGLELAILSVEEEALLTLLGVTEGRQVERSLSVCDIGVLATSRYPEQAADRERSIRVLRSLPADIWVTNHARAWGRYRKFAASGTAKNPVDPFIDPEGYRAYIDAAEAELRQGRVH